LKVRRTLFNESGSNGDQSRLNGFNSKGRCDAPSAYQLSRGKGIGDSHDGILYRNVLASYTHLHSGGAPEWAKGLVDRARLYRKTRQRVKS
jgi:hypothetical protein